MVVYAAQIQRRESRKLLTNGQPPLYFLAEAIPRFICMKFYHRANNPGKYADGFYNSVINDKDGHILSPLSMYTCTVLRHASLEWQKNNGVHLKADWPDRSNYFNYKNDGGKNASCYAATGRKLLTSPGVADPYTLLMNTWNTLTESYQQRVYKNTLATVKRQIQQVENPMPAVVISIHSARVDNAILLDYLISKVALEEPEIGSTHPTIPIDINCMDDILRFGMPGRSADCEAEGDESDERDDIPTTSRRWRPATELDRSDLGPSDVDGCEGEDGDDADADADEEEEASQADDGSTQNVEDWGHSTIECDDWTVYFREVKDDNGEANATASDVSEAKTVLQYVTISNLNINESAACGCRPKKGIHIARRPVHGYSITAALAKSWTHVSFWWCI